MRRTIRKTRTIRRMRAIRSAGTMLTLGSDLAPKDATGEFLAGMAVLQDLGRIAGPLLVGVVGTAVGLGAASIALAIVLGIAIVWLVAVIGETGEPLAAAAGRP